MPEFVQAHTREWIDHFARRGHDPAPLAAGVEGAIYDLGRGLIAKVWRQRRAAELEAMQSFYADVAAAGLPFRTPEILAVFEEVRGVFATIMGRDLSAKVDIDFLAASCIAVAREIGDRMTERDPVDVAGATDFVVRLILGGLPNLPRRD